MLRLLVLSLLAAVQPATGPVRFDGKVVDAQGKPIETAKVYVIGAGCRPEAAADCPTETQGIGKVATTQGDGQFELSNLDPRLIYKVVIVADHFKAQVRRLSVSSKRPLVVKLTPQPNDVNNDNAVTGHVTDNDGKPVAGALVTLQGEKYATGHSYGGIKNVDQQAVSGDDGAYVIIADKPGRQFDLLFEHAGYAPQLLHPASGETCEVTLSRGVKVTGRVVKDGQPLAGVQVSLAQADTNMDRFIGMFSTGTDADGKFTLEHVPENDEYHVLATMQSLRERGACSPVKVKTTGDDQADAGDLNVTPALTVSGQILMPEGKKLPANAEVYLSIEDSFDSISTKPDAQGHFKFAGVTPGVARVGVFAPGFGFSPDNASYYHDYRAMLGRVDADTTLRIKMEVKNDDEGRYSKGEADAFSAKPLEGVSGDAK